MRSGNARLLFFFESEMLLSLLPIYLLYIALLPQLWLINANFVRFTIWIIILISFSEAFSLRCYWRGHPYFKLMVLPDDDFRLIIAFPSPKNIFYKTAMDGLLPLWFWSMLEIHRSSPLGVFVKNLFDNHFVSENNCSKIVFFFYSASQTKFEFRKRLVTA